MIFVYIFEYLYILFIDFCYCCFLIILDIFIDFEQVFLVIKVVIFFLDIFGIYFIDRFCGWWSCGLILIYFFLLIVKILR